MNPSAMNPSGFFHETAFYSCDEEFLALVLPFLRGGVEAGEPTLVTFGERNSELVRSALGDTTGISFIPNAVQYVTPASTIRSYRKLLAEQLSRGARQVRIVGDVPHTRVGRRWHSWARYESAVNRALGDFPLWGLCPYDRRITPPEVLDDVASTHPFIATVDGEHLNNADYQDPAHFLSRKLLTPAPLESTPPTLELREPTAMAARRAVREVAAATALDFDHIDDLTLATSEVLNNAIRHGKPPVRLVVWCCPTRLVVTITDRGDGVRDPYAGLLPGADSTSGGLGLVIAHQLCDEVTFHRDAEGFTVRLVTGA